MTISNISLEISPSDPDQTATLGETAPLIVASNYAIAGWNREILLARNVHISCQ